MRDRIQLQTYVEGPENVGHHFTPYDTVWAAAEDQGGGRYRFRIRYRPDLRERDDAEPAMRIVYRGTTLIVDDIAESIPRVEVAFLAHREVIEEIAHLRTGTERIKSWP
jgi:hypothetical protein